MQIKKIYENVNPEIVYDEVRDLILKYGAEVDESKLQTYSLPGGSSHISRGVLTFKMKGEQTRTEKECLRVHIIGSVVGETKIILDIDETLFTPERISALEDDLNFIFETYENK